MAIFVKLKFVLVCAVLTGASFSHATDLRLVDVRYCGTPARDFDDGITRKRDVLRAFQRLYPCPATGKQTGACPGWAKDHVIPLAVGGCDSVSNLQWLPDEIKSCAGKICKDRWERIVYRLPDDPDDE
jgi:hypothetical protein